MRRYGIPLSSGLLRSIFGILPEKDMFIGFTRDVKRDVWILEFARQADDEVEDMTGLLFDLPHTFPGEDSVWACGIDGHETGRPGSPGREESQKALQTGLGPEHWRARARRIQAGTE